MLPALVKHLSAETLRVYQLRSLRLLIHAIEATISDAVNHIFLDLQSDAVLGLVSKRVSMLYGHLNVMLGQNSASTQPANSASLLRRNGHYLSCVSLASTLHRNLPQALCSKRQKADGSLSTSIADQRHLAYCTMSQITSR